MTTGVVWCLLSAVVGGIVGLVCGIVLTLTWVNMQFPDQGGSDEGELG